MTPLHDLLAIVVKEKPHLLLLVCFHKAIQNKHNYISIYIPIDWTIYRFNPHILKGSHHQVVIFFQWLSKSNYLCLQGNDLEVTYNQILVDTILKPINIECNKLVSVAFVFNHIVSSCI